MTDKEQKKLENYLAVSDAFFESFKKGMREKIDSGEDFKDIVSDVLLDLASTYDGMNTHLKMYLLGEIKPETQNCVSYEMKYLGWWPENA